METGQRLGIRTTALLVCMDSVLGHAVGNTLEVAEALECLQGRGPRNVVDVVCTIGTSSNPVASLGSCARGNTGLHENYLSYIKRHETIQWTNMFRDASAQTRCQSFEYLLKCIRADWPLTMQVKQIKSMLCRPSTQKKRIKYIHGTL